MKIDYTPAVHAAARAVETQGPLLECLVPANALVREFLLEARRLRQEKASDGVDQMAAQMKRTADSLAAYPFRVYDAASAQKVHGCGPAIAKMIAMVLFSAHPPAPLSEEELEAEQRQAAAIKAQAAAQRKRKKEAAAASGAAAAPAPAPRPPAAAAAAVAAAAAAQVAVAAGEAAEAEAAGVKRGRKKAVKEYVPQLHSANYAFLLCLFQAQKGSAKKQHLSKAELMDLAEASGLSHKPIRGDGTTTRQMPDGRTIAYDGWSNFKTLLTRGLAHEWSNPKKLSLTAAGAALAERMYRDGVPRGVLQPIPGVPWEGPLLYQPEAGEDAEAAAGLPAGVLPSAALQPGRLPAAAQQQQQQQQGQQRQQQAGPSGAAVGRPAHAWQDGAGDPLSLSLAARLQQQQQQQPARHDERDVRAAVPQRTQRGQHAPQSPPADGVIDLLSDASPSPRPRRRRSPPPLPSPLAAAAAAAAAAGGMPAWDPPLAAGAATLGAAAVGSSVLDEQVAVMVGMGYSGKKARRALRRSIGDLGLPDVGRAVEVAELLDSDGPDSDVDQAAAATAPRPAAGGAAAAPPAAQAQGIAPAARGPSRGKQAAGPSGGGLPPTATVTAAAAAGATATQRHQSGRSQQGGGGHIRGGSQPLPPALGSQQQGQGQGQAERAPSGPAYNVDAFLAGVDARLRGEAPPPPSQPAAAGGGAAPTLRVVPADVRLPPLPAGRAFSEEYEVVMLMDAREQVARSRGQGVREALERNLQQMRAGGLNVEDRHLPIGDVVWVARSRRPPCSEYVLDLVLERKSCEDLVASILGKGNRYERQKYHLKRCGLARVYYLLEGDPDTLPSDQHQKTVRTAAVTTEVLDGFTVLRTTGHQATFRLYHALTQQVQELYCSLVGAAAAATGRLPTFAAWQAQCKESGEGTVTLHDVFGMMLHSVTFLGPHAVQAILARYPTPLHLYRAYEAVLAAARAEGTDGHGAAERLLAGLKGRGSRNAVGPDKSAKVYNLLFRRRVA